MEINLVYFISLVAVLVKVRRKPIQLDILIYCHALHRLHACGHINACVHTLIYMITLERMLSVHKCIYIIYLLHLGQKFRAQLMRKL